MKKKLLVSFAVLVVVLGGLAAWVVLVGNKRSPQEIESGKVGAAQMSVTYCRPYKKDRLIFGAESASAVVPFGKYWRVGANAATQINFSKDVVFGGKPVKAGSYSLYAIPNEKSWQVVLNSEADRWGAREPDHKNDVVSVEAAAGEGASVVDQFKISWVEQKPAAETDPPTTALVLAWDKTVVSVPVQAAN